MPTYTLHNGEKSELRSADFSRFENGVRQVLMKKNDMLPNVLLDFAKD